MRSSQHGNQKNWRLLGQIVSMNMTKPHYVRVWLRQKWHETEQAPNKCCNQTNQLFFNYKTMATLDKKGMQALTVAILNRGTGPNYFKQSYFFTSCSPSIEQLEQVRLQSTVGSSLEVTKVNTKDLPVGQLLKKSGFWLYFE